MNKVSSGYAYLHSMTSLVWLLSLPVVGNYAGLRRPASAATDPQMTDKEWH
jgi:hypothetical protein